MRNYYELLTSFSWHQQMAVNPLVTLPTANNAFQSFECQAQMKNAILKKPD